MAGKQHTASHIKDNMRSRYTPWAGPGAIYVPFCGDGDLADGHYRDREADIWAVDNDPKRTDRFRERFPRAARVKTADADSWPFVDSDDVPALSIIDADAHAYPYHAIRGALAGAKFEFPVVIYGTDAQRYPCQRGYPYVYPDGTLVESDPVLRTTDYRYWWTRRLRPWLETVADELNCKLLHASHADTTAGSTMVYWAALYGYAEHAPDGDSEDGLPEDHAEQVEKALYEAAMAGDIRAMQIWLYNRVPERWSRNPQRIRQVSESGEVNADEDDLFGRLLGDADNA